MSTDATVRVISDVPDMKVVRLMPRAIRRLVPCNGDIPVLVPEGVARVQRWQERDPTALGDVVQATSVLNNRSINPEGPSADIKGPGGTWM